MVNELDYQQLDPGIRDTVRRLRAAGYQTTDSGDGRSKPQAWFDSGEALPFPHVFIVLPPEEWDSLLLHAGRVFALLGDQWRVEATFCPNDGMVIIACIGDEVTT